MPKKGRSVPNAFGGYTHYDENGKKIGSSDPGALGGYVHYDDKGKKTGRSDPNVWGGYTNYDNRGRKTGSSDPGAFGGYTHTDKFGKKSGASDRGNFDGFRHYKSKGHCYVATCVYGSYDCPQVRVLRRYRDERLSRHVPGRAFIRVYYTVGPWLVSCLGSRPGARRVWKAALDRMVASLIKSGLSDAPYRDIS